MSEFINNFYISRIFFIIITVLVAFAIISNLKNKDNIDIRKELNFKNLNFKLLFKVAFLSFFVRILVEQLIPIIGIEETIVTIPSSFLEIVIEIIVTWIFAPIFEEIIFRFGLYNKLNKKINYIISMLITSIIFAFIHDYKLDGIIIITIISLIWNYFYYKTNNLIYPIALHFLHNVYVLIDNFIISNNFNIILLIICFISYILLKIKKQNTEDVTK